MIKVQGLWHHYGVKPVLRDVSFAVPRGELIVVMGPNGMGKSTLLGLLGGVLSPLQGYVEIDGKRRRRSVEEEKAIRKQVFYLPDNPWLPLSYTGREFVLAMGRLYGVEERRLMEQADLLLEALSLDHKDNSLIATYSAGQKKKIGLCAALVSEAEVMILDEPFSGGLDSSGLLVMSKIMKSIAQRDDKTVVMAVPVPELVEGIAERIAIIVDGQLKALDTAAGLRRHSGCNGTLAEVLETLVNPRVTNSVEKYLEGIK